MVDGGGAMSEAYLYLSQISEPKAQADGLLPVKFMEEV